MEELKKEVRELLKEVDKTHRYSFSRIYNTYNKVFNTNETPTKATSALVRKVKILRLWLGEREKKESLQNLMLEFSEHDSSRMPNNGEKRTIPDNNWEALSEAIITLLTSAE